MGEHRKIVAVVRTETTVSLWVKADTDEDAIRFARERLGEDPALFWPTDYDIERLGAEVGDIDVTVEEGYVVDVRDDDEEGEEDDAEV